MRMCRYADVHMCGCGRWRIRPIGLNSSMVMIEVTDAAITLLQSRIG